MQDQDNNTENRSPGQVTPTEPTRERRVRKHDDPLRGLFWGLLLILLGVLFLGEQQGWFRSDTWWHYLLIGLGIIFLIDGAIHYYRSEYRHESYGRFIPGVILLFIGIAFVYGFDQWWPLALIAGGVVILITIFLRRR